MTHPYSTLDLTLANDYTLYTNRNDYPRTIVNRTLDLVNEHHYTEDLTPQFIIATLNAVLTEWSEQDNEHAP